MIITTSPDDLIGRYDARLVAHTYLDPMEDAVSFLSALQSTEYVSDLLVDVHGFSDPKLVRASASMIRALILNACSFLDQASEGPPQASFLPAYYAVLNLSKSYMVSGGLLEAVRGRIRHGAFYDFKRRRSLLNDEVTLGPDGVLPRFYEVLTGERWPWQRQHTIGLDAVYPYIVDCSSEYQLVQGPGRHLAVCEVSVQRQQGSGGAVVALRVLVHRQDGMPADPARGMRRRLRLLKGRFGTTKKHPQGLEYIGKRRVEPLVAAKTELMGDLRRHLLYDGFITRPFTRTPLSGSRLLLPEEVPIWIALFHLSNVVRYDPEFLLRLQDSKFWPVVMAVRRQAVFRYLLLTWSYHHKKSLSLGP